MGTRFSIRNEGSKRRSGKILIALALVALLLVGGGAYLLREKLSAAAYRPMESNSENIDDASRDQVNRFRLQIARKLWLSLFQSSGSTVADGNWIYLNEELIGANAEPAVLEEIVPVVSGFSDDLEKLGVELVFCPLPPKWAVYPDPLLGEKTDPSIATIRLDQQTYQLLTQLQESGVTCIDLLPEFWKARAEGTSLLFPPDDSHVSPAGAELVAKVLTDFLAEKHEKASSAEATDLLSSESRKLQRVGDLRSLLLHQGNEKLNDVPFDFELEPVVGNWRADPKDASSICLIGDSNLDPSLGYESEGIAHAVGIGPRLAFRRGEPVSLFWQGGDGATVPRRKFLNQFQSTPDFRNHCKVVIWIVTARTLYQPKRFEPTPVPPQVDPNTPPKRDSGWKTYTLEIESFSDTPKDLKGLAYPDGLQSLFARKIDPEHNLKGPRIVLYRDFMKKRKKIAPDWKVGDHIEVSARPWEPLSNTPAVSRLMIFDSLPFGIESRYYAVSGDRSSGLLSGTMKTGSDQ